MDFLIRSTATRAAMEAPDDPDLTERHWSYMDDFADAMTARGPLLGSDRETWAGSIHIVELAGPDAAREFVDREPNHQAGAYEQHTIWRFTNLLGRTMWQFAGPAGRPRYFVFATSAQEPVPVSELDADVREQLIVYGALSGLDDDAPAGVALALQVPTRQQLDAVLTKAFDRTGAVDVHDWEFGGRR